jgi:hypothetical protein
LGNLRPLNRTTTQRGAQRHDSQNTHVTAGRAPA